MSYIAILKVRTERFITIKIEELKTKNLINIIMAKSKDARKNVKKEATKTPKEKKAEKRLKKSKKD